MEENSESIKKLKAIVEDYPEESKEDIIAATILYDMKNQKIDAKTAKELKRLNSTYFGNDDPVAQNHPQLQENNNGVSPEYLPELLQFLGYLNKTAAFPAESLNGIVGTDYCKPLSKQLTNTDVNDNQARLFLQNKHFKEIIRPMLIEDENDDLKNGIPVKVYDSEGRQYSMVFKIWSLNFPVLTSGWTSFYKDCGFEAHKDFITLWAFRHNGTGELCFAIISRRFPFSQLLPKKPGSTPNKRKMT